MAKRVFLVSQNFYPEFFKSNDIAKELVTRGYEVDVLTGIPNYPEGVFPHGYGIFQKRVDTYSGAKVYRAFQMPRGRKASNIRLSINYLSFVFTTTFWVLFFFLFKKKYDAIIIHQTSPITQAWPGILLGKLKNIPVYTWVLDVWPDSVLSTIQSENILIKKPLDIFTDWVYRNSHRILISSPGFRNLVNRNADYSFKIVDFPNWSEDIMQMPHSEIPALPEGFKVMMAGNLSDGQGLEDVMMAARELKLNSNIYFIFVGGGAKLQWVKDYIDKNDLHRTVYTLGRFPFDCMSAFYDQADVMLLTLKKSICPHLDATIPARLQSYMSSGKAIVGMAGSGVQTLVHENECGLISDSGDFQDLVNNILRLYANKELLNTMGTNARKLYERRYTKEVCINNLVEMIKS